MKKTAAFLLASAVSAMGGPASVSRAHSLRPFPLYVRAYWPTTEIANGTRTPPAVLKAN